jgi:hypothetical protein
MIYKYVLVAALAFVGGQYYMTRAYDPAVLEEHALNFAAESYFSGCMVTPGGYIHRRGSMVMRAPEAAHKICDEKTNKYIKDMKDIWHNVAWKKF